MRNAKVEDQSTVRLVRVVAILRGHVRLELESYGITRTVATIRCSQRLARFRALRLKFATKKKKPWRRYSRSRRKLSSNRLNIIRSGHFW